MERRQVGKSASGPSDAHERDQSRDKNGTSGWVQQRNGARGECGGSRRQHARGRVTPAVNHPSYLLLSRILLPPVPPSPATPVANGSSRAQAATEIDDPMFEAGYSGSRACGQTKLAWILVTTGPAGDHFLSFRLE